jgi:PAS domain S-box-containing protein
MNGKDLGSEHTQPENRLFLLNQRLNQLVETIQKLAQARDLENIMGVVRSAARVLTGADGATFVLREGDQCYYADEDAIQPLWKGHRFPMSMCISGWVMMNHEVAVIKDIYADARIPAEAYRPTFVKSLAMVPIRSRDPLGAIGNYWANPHSPTQEEIQLLQTLADATAIALENVRLFNEQEQHLIHQKRVETELTTAYEKLKTLWGVASLIDTDIKTISDYILASITQMTESPYGFYGFVNDDESVMTIHTWSGEAMKDCSMVDKPQQYPVCQSGVWAEAIRRREPLIINDYAAPQEAKKGLPEGHVPLTSLLVVPHFFQGKIRAVAAVANREKDYGQEDITEITGFLGSVQAITDRKQHEEALERIKNLLNETSRVGNVGGWEFDIDTGKQTWTEEVYRIHELDYTYDPTVEKGVGFYTPASRPVVERAVQRAIEHGEPFDLELEIVTAKGNLRSVHAIGKADLENRRVYGFFQDITEREQTKVELQRSEQRYRLVVENTNEAIVVVQDGRAKFTNRGIEWAGYTPEEYMAIPVMETIHPEDREVVEQRYLEKISGRTEPTRYTYRGLSKSGQIHWIEVSSVLIDWEGRPATLNLITDITERKRAEEMLRESEAKFRTIIDVSPVPFALNDDKGNIVFLNNAFIGIFGYTLEDIPTLVDWWPKAYPDPEYRQWVATTWQMHLQKAKQEGTAFEPMELSIKCKDGLTRTAIVGAAALAESFKKTHLVILYDITERKQAEEDKKKLESQNRQLQKAESLGRMAGAIAHTFNNQLGAVIGNLEMAIDDLPKGSGPAHNLLTAAMRAANKAAAVSGQMLTYLGQSFDKHELMDLAEVCRRNLPILEASMPGSMGLNSDLSSPGPTVMANTNEIRQVLTNLITNACEAAGTGRGSIHLSVKTVTTANIPTKHCYPIDWQPQDNAYACLDVTDTNGGIADEDMEKLFDPFFSSKCAGRGMGLPVILGIVKAHGGAITVESKLGRGSTFRVFLPVSAEEVPRQPDKAGRPFAIEGGGTVLLLDDEEMVRDMATAMLTRLGFTVLSTKDGVEAVELFRQHQDEIRLVLSDLTMPRMDGWETLTALRKLVPDIPVILASGYDKAQVMAGDHPELPQVFLGKPYGLQELKDAINQALNLPIRF